VGNQTALERRVANLEKMIEVSRALRSAFDLRSLLQLIIEAIVELAHCERSSIFLIDPETGELRFVALTGPEFDLVRDIVVPLESSIAGTVVLSKEPLVVSDVQSDPRFFSHVDQITGQQTKSLLGVPLEIGGRAIGVLQAVNKSSGETFDEEDVETLLMFSSQAAAAIENTRLIEEQRQRLTEVVLLQEVLLTLSRYIELDQLLEQLLVQLEEFLGYENCAVLMFDKEQSALLVTAYRGFGSAGINDRAVLADEQSASGWVALHRRPINLPEVGHGTGIVPFLPATRSAVAVPMLSGQATDLVGVICLESCEPNAFTERDVRILSTIATQVAIGIRQAELYQASQRANQIKQEFITTMSHELRTPMTVIMGYCDMLSGQSLGALGDPQLSALKVIRDRSDVLLRLLNDVLDFAKIVSGQLELHPSLVNLSQAVQLAVEQRLAHGQRKNLSISIDVPLDCQYAIADAKRLHQILSHLIENAIKFSPDQRPIAIKAAAHDVDYVRIDVIDQGIGIKPEDREIIFEDFRQVDGSFTREYGGAGIGLSISRHLVELQGGLIWVESEYGKGSTFSFILPRPPSSSG
jgi:signal transduction histidine kinase